MRKRCDITLKSKTLNSILEALQENKDKYPDFFDMPIDEFHFGIYLDDFINTSTGHQREIDLLQIRFKP
jgi:hypothetical protein